MTSMGDSLPWYAFVAPSVVGLWDGGLMKSYAFRGHDITSKSEAERLQLSERIGAAFRAMDSRWSWQVESQNVAVRSYSDSEFDLPAAALVDAERRADCLARGAQYEMRHWLSLVQNAPGRGASALARLFTSGADSTFKQEQITSFERRADEFAGMLRGLVRVSPLDDDQTASLLHSTISTERQFVRARDHQVLSESLGSERFTRGIGLSRLGKSYAAVLTIGGFTSAKSHPQLLAGLSSLPFEFRWSSRWIVMERETAKQMMSDREQKALGQQEYAKDAILKYIESLSSKRRDDSPPRKDREEARIAEEAATAAERLNSRGYGLFASTFVVTDRPTGDSRAAMNDSRRRCLEKADKIRRVLKTGGLIVRDETIEPVKPWRMSLPGNREVGRRTFPISTRNLADLLPTSSVWQGTEFDASLAKATGVKRPWMYTADPIPYRLNTDVPGGAAHSLLLGATGQAGKSTLANHLGLQFLGWPKTQVISLSIGRSEIGPCLLSGGAVYTFAGSGSLALQPMAYVDEPDEALAASEWLQLCLDEVGEKATPEDVDALGHVLQLMASPAVDRKRRTMTTLVDMLTTRSPRLALALKIYTRAGHYGHIFDGDDAGSLERRRWTMIDLAALLKMRPAVIVPAVAYLLHRITRWFDRPTLVQLEEFPDWMHHAPLEKFAIRLLDTERHRQVRALMIAQTPGQLAQHTRLMASVKSGCATKIYGPDAEARTQAASYADLGVTPTELEHIANLPLGSFLLKNTYGARPFATRVGPIAMALTSTDDRALFAELGQRCSNPDEMLSEYLKIKGLEEKARRLGWKSTAKPELLAAE